MAANRPDPTPRRMLWSCRPFAGGRHFYAFVGLLNANREGYQWRRDHPKFVNAERALMWIEREFAKLSNCELWDFEEQIEGVKAMRAHIRALAEKQLALR